MNTHNRRRQRLAHSIIFSLYLPGSSLFISHQIDERSSQIDEGLDVHAAYTLIWLGDMDVEQTKSRSGDTLSGTYRNAALPIIGGGATWRF